ncbi:MAG: serine/threonine-protein kinase [Deltaproteobacteria bacterium]|nr:serine/threonine-protein kinase [Deltaproteobacteria bacterium]
MTDASVFAESEVPRDTVPPRTIGRYIAVDVLGAGGMGTVFAAHDPELDRKVALKLLHARDAAKGHTMHARSRLQREARAIAKVKHPNVIHVYDVGVVSHEGEQQVFVAMELVEGRSLRQWLAQLHETDLWRRGGATREIVQVMAQAGRGLAAAHHAGLVHRDFKPDNALLGDDGQVRVVDFGLARRVDGSADSVTALPPVEPSSGHSGSLDERLTRTGAKLGTPAYMAPEQFRGEPTDGRTDQFSFCLTLYEALYGVRAFPHKGYALAAAVVRGEQRPRPTEPGVPAHLRALLERGLQTDPGDRFPSMDELVAALIDDPVRRRRQRLRWAAGGTVAVASAAASVAMRPGPPESRDECGYGQEHIEAVWNTERQQAVQASLSVESLPYAERMATAASEVLGEYAGQWTQAHRDACEATHVRNEQTGGMLDKRMACLDRRLAGLEASIDLLATAEPEQVEHAVAAVEGLPSLAACADRTALDKAGPPPPDEATADAVGEVQAQLERAAARQRLHHFTEALAMIEALAPRVEAIGHAPLHAEWLFALGNARAVTQEPQTGSKALRDAMMRAQALGMDALVRDAASRLSWVLGTNLAKPEEALPWADLAEATDERLGSTPKSQATLLRTRAWVLVEWGMKPEAIDVVARAHAAAIEAYEPNDYAMLIMYSSLGSVYARLGALDKARPHFEHAVQLGVEQLGPDHPMLLTHYRNLGNVLSALDELDEADRYIERASALADRIPGITATDKALIASARGNQAFKREEFEAAIEHHRRALLLREQAYGPDHPIIARSLNSMGAAAKRLDRVDDATAWYFRSLAIREKAMGPEHPSLLIVLDNIGSMLVEDGRFDDALPVLERAHALMLAHGDVPYREADHRFWLGVTLVQTGTDNERGLSFVNEALERFEGLKRSERVEQIQRWLDAHPSVKR